jgi:hypothetical protein
MTGMKRLGFMVMVLVLMAESLNAQSFYAVRRERSLIAVGGIGTSTYFGELANPGDYIDAEPTLSAGLQYYFTNRISARAELSWFQLKGDDAKADPESGRRERNLSFQSNNIEFSLVGQINLFAIGQRFYQRPKINFYGILGIGVLYTNPKAEYQGEKYALQPLKTEGVSYSRFQPVIPYGLGVRYMFDPFLNISIEGAYRQLFTDYLDDVSTIHPDKSSWDNSSIRYKLSDRRVEYDGLSFPTGYKRGNPEENDGYFHLQVKVEYYLPNNFLFGGGQKKLYNKKRKGYYRRRR